MASSVNTSVNHPYIPSTDSERAEMLDVIGVDSLDGLLGDIPVEHRHPKLDIDAGLSEQELSTVFGSIAAENASSSSGYISFLGAGSYSHYIPSTVRSILQRGEFVTAYTPYQPEAAQGTLQVGFEFQTIICQLTGMEVANAGMYDGPTAFAEACLMAARVTKRTKIGVLSTADQRLPNTLMAYSKYQGIEIVEVSPDATEIPDDLACIGVQSPNFFGEIEDIERLTNLAHANGALSVVHVNPTALGMFKAPGEFDVDIVTAEGQPLGVPMAFGGPYVGLFACKKAHIRQMPGRIIGRTTDTKGRTGYALTLQTREQHIRRERATSNICTSTQLIGLMVTVYTATLGKQGMKDLASLCYQKAHYAASEINRLDGFSVESLDSDGTFFHEFVVSCPASPSQINASLLDKKIIGGLDISDRSDNGMLVCVTETNSKADIDKFVQALSQIGASA
ncbi:MAG: aminomethyl-transferring glycine dehydrogenase subunit GcvPA [Chloroflexi bacterium]|jgi:glycine dehydrogenase subunit 1|nr:aminomethyl-transferring glycine dehydrogenase subunit GcvPA [Chloroflexota bacterium]